MRWALIILATFASYASGQPGQKELDAALQAKKVVELERRVKQRDFSALADARKLPPETGIQFLLEQARFDPSDPDRRDRALLELRHVHGVKGFFEQRLATKDEYRRDPTRLFAALTAIGNDEAAEILAPYLFDFTIGNEREATAFNISAAVALGGMRLPDTPTTKRPSRYGLEDLIGWQKWAIKRQFVPATWTSRIGLPEWQIRAFEFVNGPSAVKAVSEGDAEQPEAHTSTSPESARSAPTPDPVLIAATPEPTSNFGTSNNRWLAIISFLVVCAAGLFIYRRRFRAGNQ